MWELMRKRERWQKAEAEGVSPGLMPRLVLIDPH